MLHSHSSCALAHECGFDWEAMLDILATNFAFWTQIVQHYGDMLCTRLFSRLFIYFVQVESMATVAINWMDCFSDCEAPEQLHG